MERVIKMPEPSLYQVSLSFARVVVSSFLIYHEKMHFTPCYPNWNGITRNLLEI